MKKKSSIFIALFLGIIALAALMLRSSKKTLGEAAEATQSQQPAAEVTQKPVETSPVLEAVAGETALDAVPDEVEVAHPMHMRMAEIQKTIGFNEQSGQLYDLMNEASLEEVQQLLALSEDDLEYSAGLRSEMMAAAFERWYQLDPAAAIRALDASALSQSRKDSRVEVYLENWASRSPQEVEAFLQQGALTGVSADLVYSALARGSATNGDRAMLEDALSRIQEPKKRLYAVKSVARTLQRDHADLYEAWLPTLSPEDQATALAEGAWMLADKDIERALDRLGQLEDLQADELPVTRSRVVVKWGRNDPAKAGEWVLSQELPAEERESLFALVFKVWVKKDRAAAVGWVESSIERGEIDEAFMNRVAAQM